MIFSLSVLSKIKKIKWHGKININLFSFISYNFLHSFNEKLCHGGNTIFLWEQK